MLRNIFSLPKEIFLVLICIGLGSGARANDASKPPIVLPFYPQKIGESYSFNVNIAEQLTYSIDVRFYISPPSKWSHFFDNESSEEANQIHDILGGGKFVNHEWIEPGVPAKFRVQITQKIDSKIVLDEFSNRPKTSSCYMGRYAILARKILPPGAYSIRIDYIEGAPEITPLNANIVFARAHHGK